MKRIVGFAGLVLLSSSLLAGCGDAASGPKEEGTEVTQEVQASCFTR